MLLGEELDANSFNPIINGWHDCRRKVANRCLGRKQKSETGMIYFLPLVRFVPDVLGATNRADTLLDPSKRTLDF
jgi:hypothetical protein